MIYELKSKIDSLTREKIALTSELKSSSNHAKKLEKKQEELEEEIKYLKSNAASYIKQLTQAHETEIKKLQSKISEFSQLNFNNTNNHNIEEKIFEDFSGKKKPSFTLEKVAGIEYRPNELKFDRKEFELSKEIIELKEKVAILMDESQKKERIIQALENVYQF